ncbi:hypothetical protein M3210_18170 [Oceanobacillus luteolus]|uniref:hypothetical protein n=1 Tax=Oceanobacillus luteolus TaxID=1274358 RepID=UPI002040B319|nr:hypothetical protein [Oceanobacillus luteolus]MCM3742163.1 hypothetical protein [Oceanobacillus luteolus]
MKEFELSFKNKYVKMWFVWMIPLIILTLLLFIFLPLPYHWIPALLLTISANIFYAWVKLDKRKKSGTKMDKYNRNIMVIVFIVIMLLVIFTYWLKLNFGYGQLFLIIAGGVGIFLNLKAKFNEKNYQT